MILLLLVAFCYTNFAGAQVIGYVGPVVKTATGADVHGWTCVKNLNQSIGLHIYAGGSYQEGGKHILTGKTQLDSESAIHSLCNTSGSVRHRFKVAVPENMLHTYRNQSIYIHGIHPGGGQNLLLKRSGEYRLPDPFKYDVTGYVGPVVKTSSGADIHGWACVTNWSQPINVHVYLGGSYQGGGKHILTAKTEESSESAIHDICRTSGQVRHRFKVAVNEEILRSFRNQPVFIHGIHPLGGENLLLKRSGQYYLPDPIDYRVKGYIDRITKTSTGAVISGWTCVTNHNQSIEYHVYAGGSYGNGGTHILTGRTSLESEGAIHSLCKTTSSVSHRFNIPVSREVIGRHRGKTIHIHGINPFGQHLLIGHSGKFSLPARVNYQISEMPMSPSKSLILKHDNFILNQSIDVEHLHLREGARLICPQNLNAEIRTQGILIDGKDSAFICGSREKRFLGRLNILLRRDNEDYGHAGKAYISARNHGLLYLHGDGKGTAWTKLNATAPAGASRLRFTSAVNWRVGDEIVVASTSFDMNQAERRKIAAIDSDNHGVTLNAPLSHRHYGKMQNHLGKIIDMRAEVVNLTRNIVIQPEGEVRQLEDSRFGGHIMVMKSARGFVDSVELVRMGQAGLMGRYPFHWHRAGNVKGQYIRNSSIHDTYQRCVTVHGSHHALIENNVCYNHFGHGFFLENGNEVYNTFRNNVGLVTKRPRASQALLQTDFKTHEHGRFKAPATFWISNPKNTFTGNVAAGSEGSGFWHAFVEYLSCNDNRCEVKESASEANVFPAFERTLKFDNNLAHSSNIGITWDGAPRGPKVGNPNNPDDREALPTHYFNKGHGNPDGPMPEFRNLTAYKSLDAGLYYRGNQSRFFGTRLADNSLNFFIAYNQQFFDTLVVGISENTSHQEEVFRIQNVPSGKKEYVGFVAYDGPTEFNGITFAEFKETPVVYNGIDVTPVVFQIKGGTRSFEHSFENIQFADKPLRKVDFQKKTGWHDARVATRILIKDNSFDPAGRPGELVVPDHEILDDSSCRVLDGGRGGALACKYNMGLIHFEPSKTANDEKMWQLDYSATRIASNGSRVDLHQQADNASREYANKLAVILDKGYRYDFDTDDEIVTDPAFYFESKDHRRISPLLSFSNYRNCLISGARQLQSYSEVENFNGTDNVYFRNSQGVYFVRAVTYHQHQRMLHYFSPYVRFSCPQSSSAQSDTSSPYLRVFNPMRGAEDRSWLDNGR